MDNINELMEKIKNKDTLTSSELAHIKKLIKLVHEIRILRDDK